MIQGGVNLIIEDVPAPGHGQSNRALQLPSLVSIGVWADRMVIWTRGVDEPDLGGDKLQSADTPFEIYMDGNIIFREEERVIYAQRMYYDATNQVATVLDAEVLTPVPRYEGLLRLHAEVIRQTGRGQFVASDAFFTSSRLGSPGYRLQAGSVSFEDIQEPRLDPVTGLPLLDPRTHEPEVDHRQMVTSENNLLFVDDLPVFYWPRMATDLKDSSYYIRRAEVKNDSIFGFQAITEWDLYQLLGIHDRPAGTKWGLGLDWFSKRGFGHATDFRYDRPDFLGIPGRAVGLIDYFGIDDHGTDDLGLSRRSVPLEQSYRYRLFAQHRQMLEGNVQMTAQLGLISDDNFLQQYFKREWDEMPDEVTSAEFKKIRDNNSWTLTVGGRLNDFFTQTDWLPRLDHFWLGQPLLGGSLVWFEHSSAAYAQFHTLDLPNPDQEAAPAIQQRYLPWEVSPTGQPLNTQSSRFFTRQEIDYPFQAGPVKLVPYALGEAAHWDEARNGDDLNRYYGQLGLRASIPVWHVDPTVESTLWNLHGLAHKIVFDAEAAYATTNHHVDELPLYDPLDDDSIENFRRLFVPWTFPTPGTLAPTPAIPKLFDERILRHPHGHGRLGHVAESGDCRRPRLRPPGNEAPLADEAGSGGRRLARQRADRGLDHHRHEHHTVSENRAGLRPVRRAVGLRRPVADRRPAGPALVGHFRFLRERSAAGHGGGFFGPAAQERALRGRPHAGRPDQQHGPHVVVQLPDEPEVGRRLRGVDGHPRLAQHRPDHDLDAGWRVVPDLRRLQFQRQPRELGGGHFDRAAVPAQDAARPGRRRADPRRRGVWTGMMNDE